MGVQMVDHGVVHAIRRSLKRYNKYTVCGIDIINTDRVVRKRVTCKRCLFSLGRLL